MTPLQPIVALAGAMRSLRLWAGKQLTPFTGGNVFSPSKHNEMRAVANCFLNPQVVPNSAGQITITDSGWALQLFGNTGSGGGPAQPGGAGTYVLMSVQGDYLTVRTYDGNTIGNQDVYVAKPYKLRLSIAQATIFGVPHFYTYAAGPDAANPSRNNFAAGASETEFVTPPWLAMDIVGPGGPPDIIFALAANTLVNGPNGAIGLLQTSDSRQWATLS